MIHDKHLKMLISQQKCLIIYFNTYINLLIRWVEYNLFELLFILKAPILLN